MEEETVRSRHKNSFSKIKEKASIDKAKKQVKELDKIKQEYLDKGQDNKMPKIKKKKRAILEVKFKREKELKKKCVSLTENKEENGNHFPHILTEEKVDENNESKTKRNTPANPNLLPHVPKAEFWYKTEK